MTDFYRLLDLPPTASDVEVRQRLDELEKKWFYRRNNAPNMERRHEADRWTSELEAARRTLLNPDRRRDYDRSRGPTPPPPPRGSTPPDPTGPPGNPWPTPGPPPAPTKPPTPNWGNPPNTPSWSQPPSGPSGGPPTPTNPYGGPPPRSGQLSSVGRRFGAYMLDLLLSLVTLFIGWFIWFLAIAESGQTPGKSLMNMYTVDATTGQRIGFGRMAARELLLKGVVGYVIMALTSGFAIPLMAWLLWDHTRQQLWDKPVNTVVVDG